MDQILHQVLQTFFWPRYTINQTVQSIHIYNYIYICTVGIPKGKHSYMYYTPAQAEFLTRVVVVRERMQSKELETTGKWLTEEKMKAEYDKYL